MGRDNWDSGRSSLDLRLYIPRASSNYSYVRMERWAEANWLRFLLLVVWILLYLGDSCYGSFGLLMCVIKCGRLKAFS